MKRINAFLIAVYAILALGSTVFAQAPSLLEPLKVERAKFPRPLTDINDACVILARTVRGRADYGLLAKSSGAGCTLPNGQRFSGDVIIYAPLADSPEPAKFSEHFDTLYDWDGEKLADPKWDSVGPCVVGPKSGCDMKNFVRIPASMYLPGDDGSPAPVPPVVVTPPANVDLGPITARLDALSALYDELRHTYQVLTDQVTFMINEHAVLVNRVTALEARPTVTSCSAAADLSFIRIPISCKVQ